MAEAARFFVFCAAGGKDGRQNYKSLRKDKGEIS
jgi:hypothetical protein